MPLPPPPPPLGERPVSILMLITENTKRFSQCCFNAGSQSATSAQHQTNIISTPAFGVMLITAVPPAGCPP